MRYLPGYKQELVGESINSLSLMNMAISEPDILPTVFSLWQNEYTPLTSLLNDRQMKSYGLFEGLANNRYRVVGSNIVMYAIPSSTTRKVRFKAGPTGETFKCDAYPTQPGRFQSIIYIYLDNNWVRPKEVIELSDNQTQLYVYTEEEPVEQSNGTFRYEVKVVPGTDATAFVDPVLMADGKECAPVQTMYEHDFSETGSEKYTVHGWGKAYMTLQRLKYSWSGTAASMKTGIFWTTHAGEQTYLTYAENEMMKRAAQYHEYQIVFGKGTVAVDGTVMMKDKRGREVMAGQGILHQGDGAMQYPFPPGGWNMNFLHSILRDLYLAPGVTNDSIEVVFLAGFECYRSFNDMLTAKNIQQRGTVVGEGAEKGISDSYAWYEIDGVKIIPKRWRWFDSPQRPAMWLDDGTKKGSWDGIFVSLGRTSQQENGIELIQLRPMKIGTVHGIDVGGEMMTSVDGSHKHVLFQTGVIRRSEDSVARIFRNYK